MKLLSLPDTLHVLSPSLRFCISGFHNQKSSYHISARFASAEADFMAIFRFCLCFPPGYGILSATFYWKEGAPTWVGTAAFSSKKETPKLFRLEVYPFIPFSRAWSMIYAPRSFAMGRFCFAQKYIKRVHISIHNNRKGVPHEP